MTTLEEAGRTISRANLLSLKAAYKALKDLFSAAKIEPEEDEQEDQEVTEADLSMADLMTRITAALKKLNPLSNEYGLYVKDLFPGYVVYQPRYSGPTYAIQYTQSDRGVITLGDQTEVLSRTSYETPDGSALPWEAAEAQEAQGLTELHNELTPLTEAASTGGTVRVKLIAPGKGSSGYYPRDVLKRDGPTVFRKGLPMYVNHATVKEATERPEGDLNRMAAVLVSDAQYEESAPEGEGLYASVKVFADHKEALKDKAPYTGVSINALGKTSTREVEGLGKLPVVESIVSARSVDFVTKAGAGGKVVGLIESATSNEGEDQMGDELREALEAQKVEIARLREAMAIAQAQPLIEQRLKLSGLPMATRERIKGELSLSVTLTEAGALDTAALEARITEALTREAQYLSRLGAGAVRGMGNTGAPMGGEQPTTESLKERIDQGLKRLSSI